MFILKRVCPKCAEFVDKKAKICPYCGEEFDKEKEIKVDDKSAEFDISAMITYSDGEPEVNQTEVSQTEENETENNETRKRHPHKKKQPAKEVIDAKVDENGEINVETKDVTFFEGATENYSVKAARGETKKQKPKWWEIYKWADIYLARKKINKEVNKAARVEPPFVNHWVLLTLAILFGYVGAHNYYAKNNRRGLFITISLILALIVVAVPVLRDNVGVSIGGGLGFVVLSCWIWDIVAIIWRRFKFRESRLQFICKLNLATREKLGEKYVNIKEWFIPYDERKLIKKNAKKRRKQK